MKKAKRMLKLRKIITWIVAILIIVAMVYFSNPFSVPDNVQERIRIEEGLQ